MPKIAPDAPTLFTCGFHITLAMLPHTPATRYSAVKRRLPNRRSTSWPTCHSAIMLNSRCSRLPCRNSDVTMRHHSPCSVRLPLFAPQSMSWYERTIASIFEFQPHPIIDPSVLPDTPRRTSHMRK